MKGLSKLKDEIERLAPEDQKELAHWIGARAAAQAAAKQLNQPKANPTAVNRKLLPGFSLKRIPMGWKGKFPDNPVLFGKPVLLIVETEEMPDFSKLPRALTSLQAALVQTIAQGLSSILKTARKEVEAIGIEPAEDGGKVPLNIYVWLRGTNDDGKSWEFVVERADGSNFAYHLAYQGTKFIEMWAGD